MIEQRSDNIGASFCGRLDEAVYVELKIELVLGVVLSEPIHKGLVLIVCLLANCANPAELYLVCSDEGDERREIGEETDEKRLGLKLNKVIRMSLAIAYDRLKLGLFFD